MSLKSAAGVCRAFSSGHASSLFEENDPGRDAGSAQSPSVGRADSAQSRRFGSATRRPLRGATR